MGRGEFVNIVDKQSLSWNCCPYMWRKKYAWKRFKQKLNLLFAANFTTWPWGITAIYCHAHEHSWKIINHDIYEHGTSERKWQPNSEYSAFVCCPVYINKIIIVKSEIYMLAKLQHCITLMTLLQHFLALSWCEYSQVGVRTSHLPSSFSVEACNPCVSH